MKWAQVFRRLAKMKGEFVRYGDVIRHKTKYTLGGSPCCPLAAVCDTPPRDNTLGSLRRQLSLPKREMEDFIVAVDDQMEHLPPEKKEIRRRVLKAVGIR